MPASIQKRRRVLVAGTFEIIHPGHIALIQEAASLGEVYVVVARDATVSKIRHRPPIVPEQQRLAVIQSVKGVDVALLGNENQEPFMILNTVKPNLILLGPNQNVTIEELEKWLKVRNLKIEIQRMATLYSRCPLCSTSSIIAKILELNSKNELGLSGKPKS